MSPNLAPRGLIIAAPRSGAGKTTITLGLLRTLHRSGIAIQPFKCGPDYIDPQFHSAATGRPSINLDTWAMRPQLIAHLIATASANAELCVVEGVMGLFDGVEEAGQTSKGATADLAALTGWPVVLVLDVTAQAETAAAVALGCQTYRSDVHIAGVILNCIGSPRHERLVSDAIARIGLPVLGALHRTVGLTLPERHLGLVQAIETGDLDRHLDRLADVVSAAIPKERILPAAGPLHIAARPQHHDNSTLRPPGQRIALARDQAFSFTYPHLIDGWRAAGAQIIPFSPLDDETPDASADAVWLPGGYPELHGPTLANASRFKAEMRNASERGVAIHGECGGYMVLGAGLVDGEGHRHEMVGLLGLETSFAKRKLHLGYRRARLLTDASQLARNSELFGHEFHYATVIANPDAPLAEVRNASGNIVPERGSRRGSVTGTFFHVIDEAVP